MVCLSEAKLIMDASEMCDYVKIIPFSEYEFKNYNTSIIHPWVGLFPAELNDLYNRIANRYISIRFGIVTVYSIKSIEESVEFYSSYGLTDLVPLAEYYMGMGTSATIFINTAGKFVVYQTGGCNSYEFYANHDIILKYTQDTKKRHYSSLFNVIDRINEGDDLI
jgi:hypothetical protein